MFDIKQIKRAIFDKVDQLENDLSPQIDNLKEDLIQEGIEVEIIINFDENLDKFVLSVAVGDLIVPFSDSGYDVQESSISTGDEWVLRDEVDYYPEIVLDNSLELPDVDYIIEMSEEF